jgi:hypothetical protein
LLAPVARPEDATVARVGPATLVEPTIKTEVGQVSAESIVVPVPVLAGTPAPPLAPASAPTELVEIERPPHFIEALRRVTISARPLSGTLAPPRPESARAWPVAQLRPERNAGVAAQRCRAIVVKTQLGEDPSDADRDFLRRGCPAGR